MKYLLLVLVLAVFTSTFAQDKSDFKVTGYVFGDYFYKAGGDTLAKPGYKSQYWGNSSDKVTQYVKGFSAFQMRRVYLGFYYNLNPDFSTTVLFEGNDGSFAQFTSAGIKQSVYVKQAFVEWKSLVPNASLYIGLVPTPTFGVDEAIWNYRSVEKTPGDARALGQASDFGVSLKGKFDDAGMVTYHATIGNGPGQAFENNKYKVFYGSIDVKPVKDLIVELYSDYAPASDGVKNINASTFKAIAGYKVAGLNLGAEFFSKTFRNSTLVSKVLQDKVSTIFSVFGYYPVMNNLNLLARFDAYDPDKNDADGKYATAYKETFVTVGADYSPNANIHIIPNIWANSFSPKGTNLAKGTDLVYRITYHFIFK